MLINGLGCNIDWLYCNDFDLVLGYVIYINVFCEVGIMIEGFGLGVSIFDVNVDGWLDIYVGNDYFFCDLFYFNNQDGIFIEAVVAYFGYICYFLMGNSVGDINNDGYFDFFMFDMLFESYYCCKLMFGFSQYDKFQCVLQYGYGYQYMCNMFYLFNGQGQYVEIG